MNWMMIITLVLKFLGPLLEKLLEDLFKSAQVAGSPAHLDPGAGMERLFAAARKQTWWVQFRKRTALAVAERIAVRRAPEFWLAAQGLALPPVPTVTEQVELDTAA